jgi:hypothetical protein
MWWARSQGGGGVGASHRTGDSDHKTEPTGGVMTDEPYREREAAIDAAIRSAALEGSHAEHFKHLLEQLERDDVR